MDDLSIALVEDDHIDAEAVRRALRRRGVPYRLRIFRDGDEALEAARRGDLRRPCFFVLDLNLPRLPGFALLETLQAGSYLAGCEVTVLTTSTADADRARAASLGVRQYLTKSDRAALGRLIDLIEAYAASHDGGSRATER